MSNRINLDATSLAELASELDAVRLDVLKRIGEQDAKHIHRMRNIVQMAAIAGRSALMFGIGPISWLAGVMSLALAKIIENMEVGHNVMHGQYDWMNEDLLNSQTYEWDIVCDGDHWRHSHNVEHHDHTNIIGKDHDFGYGMLRLSEQQRWSFATLLQPIWYGLLAINFQWGVAVHDIKIGRFVKGKMTSNEFHQRLRPFLKKAGRQLFKDYVLFPALAFWQWPRVLLGNLLANLIRNLWTNAIIFCGHFTEHVHTYSKQEVENETRGQWYLRQIQGSSNLQGGAWFHLLSGHLSHQIEHHLFPDLPAPRYPEIAPRIKAICQRYGIHYNTGGFWRQYSGVVWRILKFSLPNSKTPARVFAG